MRLGTGVAVHPAGASQVPAAGRMAGVVTVVDRATWGIRKRVYVGRGQSEPYAIAVHPDGRRVYVTSNFDPGLVSVIDVQSETVVAEVQVEQWPQGLSVTPEGDKRYVADGNDNTVSVIDTATNSVMGTIPVGRGPVAFGQFIGPAPASPSLPPTPTPTPPGPPCPGDCDGNDIVAVDELVVGVSIALGRLPIERCPSCNLDGDGQARIEELVGAVNAALKGCGGALP